MTTDFITRFAAAVDYFREQLATLRTGRAAPSLVERLLVDCYGSRLPLIQVAAVTAPEPRLLVIQPWDPTLIKDIERAVQASSLGLQPTVDGQTIRLNIPQLTEERRKELRKVLGQYEESAKVAIKRIREETLKGWKELERSGELSEDALARQEKILQEALEANHALLKKLTEEKSSEIMTI